MPPKSGPVKCSSIAISYSVQLLVLQLLNFCLVHTFCSSCHCITTKAITRAVLSVKNTSEIQFKKIQ